MSGMVFNALSKPNKWKLFIILKYQLHIIFCARSTELMNKMSLNELENVIATGRGLQKVLEIVTVSWYC